MRLGLAPLDPDLPVGILQLVVGLVVEGVEVEHLGGAAEVLDVEGLDLPAGAGVVHPHAVLGLELVRGRHVQHEVVLVLGLLELPGGGGHGHAGRRAAGSRGAGRGAGLQVDH